MRRTTSTDRELNKFGTNKDGFTDGDPTTGTPATTLEAASADAFQEELATIVEQSGRDLDGTRTNQAVSAIRRMINLGVMNSSCNVKSTAGALFNPGRGCYNPAQNMLVSPAPDSPPFGAYAWENFSEDPFLGSCSAGQINRINHDGNTTYVAVGEVDSGAASISRTTDPTTSPWTSAIANPKAFALNSVAFGNSTWVAVGDYDGSDAYIVTSSNGLAPWTERSNSCVNNMIDVVWCEGFSLFVAVDSAGSTYTSPDGITWTARTPGVTVGSTLCYLPGVGVNGRLVADSYHYTDDGITAWSTGDSSRVTISGGDLTGYGHNLYRVGGAVSFDAGETWENNPNPFPFKEDSHGYWRGLFAGANYVYNVSTGSKLWVTPGWMF